MRQTGIEPRTVTPPEAEEVRAELCEILGSSAFLKSDRHARFLQFVCETALRGEASKLSEYTIAHEVFGRGSEYSPGEDSVVRRQAYSLRQKIAEYYVGEGSKHSIHIELPVGRYVPVFVRKEPSPELARIHDLPAQLNPPAALSAGLAIWKPIAIALIAIALVGLGWSIGHVARSARSYAVLDPTLEEIWKPWLQDPDGAVICFSNPMTTVVKQFSFPLAEDPQGDPPRVRATAEQAAPLRKYFKLPSNGFLVMYPAISQSKTGEAMGSVMMSSFLTKAGVPVRATQSRFLSWENFRTQNLILLGHDEANPWLDPILEDLPIRMATNNGEKARRIIVTEKGAVKPTEFYLDRGKDAIPRDYALVTMIEGIDGRHQLLLINGLNTEGTQIAMDYLCHPNTVRSLLHQLRTVEAGHVGDWHFQIVLRTEVRDQVPTEATLLVTRVL